jgi:hypothetical protein
VTKKDIHALEQVNFKELKCYLKTIIFNGCRQTVNGIQLKGICSGEFLAECRHLPVQFLNASMVIGFTGPNGISGMSKIPHTHDIVSCIYEPEPPLDLEPLGPRAQGRGVLERVMC